MASSNQHVRASHAPWSCELLALICEIVCEHSKTPAPSYGTRSLTWLCNFKDPESQVARWPEYLKEYDVEVVYRRGRHHDSADAMSGRPEVTMDNLDHPINETPSAAVGTAAVSLSTTEGAALLEALKDGLSDSSGEDGLTPAGLAIVVTRMATRTVPPTHAHLSFLEQLHNGISGGHLHVKKMAEKQNGTHREQGPDRKYSGGQPLWKAVEIDGPEWVRPPDVLTKSSNVQGPGNVNPTGVLYNASIHETTGNAPFEMMLGNATTTSKYVKELAAHFRNAFAAARKHSAEQQTRQRYYYDQTTGNSHYEDQEAVWLYCAATKSKPNRKVVILWTAVCDRQTCLRVKLSHPAYQQRKTSVASTPLSLKAM
ncbi:hypothetical protein T10_13379 [Trichinella papuae]|uniref:Retrovirus-related Pol polyprotein from transposon n=1 Tax=Trichinella papuae TaxID=268474 RepID=A0A0V1MG51_9BILA|nr:hypothetical protein T10_13379 [Trichinella papuae]